jgi:putative phosphoribosyl transferase
MLFRDRHEAGRCLAERLQHLRPLDPVVLALPRGGVPVGRAVADGLGAPLGLVIARKIGVPFQPEVGMGAIGEDGTRIVHDAVVRASRVTATELDRARLRERVEVDRRARCFRLAAGPRSLEGRTVVVVDDGVATGSTAWVGCRIARTEGAAQVVLAAPIAATHPLAPLDDVTDGQVYVRTFDRLGAIGRWYREFPQVDDDQVKACLGPAVVGRRPAERVPVRRHEVQVASDGARVRGLLTVPRSAAAVVVAVQGSGTARHSPRTRHVADALHRAGLATLTCDLLSPAEELDRSLVFDVGLLARRALDVLGWLGTTEVASLPVGVLGIGTGAAAALAVAGVPGAPVAAVVSVSGQPGLARSHLAAVRAPVLLVVAGHGDRGLLGLNRQALAQLRSPSHLAVVRGATDVFEEPGALTQVAGHARGWFLDHAVPGERLTG